MMLSRKKKTPTAELFCGLKFSRLLKTCCSDTLLQCSTVILMIFLQCAEGTNWKAAGEGLYVID